MILVDTSVWVDFLNSARGPAGDELERLISVNAALVLTGLAVAEVLQGLKRDVAPVTRLLVQWPLVEPGGFATYETAATIFRQARERGVSLSTVDALLAAVALEYDAALFTLDRDFERLAFTGLRLYR
ncbi:MAG TPA: PIN domain nuclease [Terriglobia bacterium]|nr:PIN domain nuclease [Terriglobia bacterium]